jgi:elongation factor 2
MKYSVSPVVRVAVAPKHPQDLPKLIEGLRILAKADPLIQCYAEETGEQIVAGCGELHVEVCLKELENIHARIPIVKSDPVVTYKETVTDVSSIVCLSKSANRHNRIYAQAEPLGEDLIRALEDGEISARDDMKELCKTLSNKFEWDISEAKKIWSFGPDETGSNILVDATKGVQYMNEVRDHVKSAF